MTVLTAAEVLREARALIIERGWGPLTGGTSIYQAVALAVLGHALGEDGPFAEEAHWAAAVEGPCRYIDHMVAIRGYVGIAHWEMADGRTQQEVLDVLELAIAAAERATRTTAVAA